METLIMHHHNNGGNFAYDYDSSACSTPYVSAPSSPGRLPRAGGFFYSAPTSPARSPSHQQTVTCRLEHSLKKMEDDAASGASASPGGSGSDFEFSARFSEFDGGAVSADELFCNGQIKPMRLAAHLEKPQVLRPLIDFEDESKEAAARILGSHGHMAEEEGGRGRERELWRDMSRHRRTRSLSPLRNPSHWEDEVAEAAVEPQPEPSKLEDNEEEEEEEKSKNGASAKKGRGGSKRWMSLKDFLYRSKSEGRGHTRERLWALSFSSSPAKQNSSEKHKASSASKKQQAEPPANKQPEKPKAKNKNVPPNSSSAAAASNSNRNNIHRKVPVSAHELHYTANRAQAEELKRKTYLPYRQGLLGCLGFSSKSYSTMNGLARTLHPLS